MQYCHARRTTRATGRAVQFAWVDGDRIPADFDTALFGDRHAEFTERNMRPVRIVRVSEAELFVGGAERCLTELALGLAAKDDEVRVFSCGALPTGPLRQRDG